MKKHGWVGIFVFLVWSGLVPGEEFWEGPDATGFLISPRTAENFNLVLGTQNFSPAYQLTTQPRLLEAAEAMGEMGSRVIKFGLGPKYANRNGNVPQADPGIRSLRDLVSREPTYRKVLDMPFTHFVFWAHSFQPGAKSWLDGFSPEEARSEYMEIYDLTGYLIRKYAGSGKIFYLGHWEGDGWLRTNVRKENDVRVTPVAVGGMRDWLHTRQRAVDDAKRDCPPQGVQVWHYTEVNHVQLAMEGRPAMANRVLPGLNVDLVSYSCYDTQNDSRKLKAALDYLESVLSPRPDLTGRRIFLGEYGFPADRFSPREQDRKARSVIQAGLEWGCPLILYWQLYNNEVTADGQQRGFWLIDSQGNQQPIYETHRKLLKAGKEWTQEVAKQPRAGLRDSDFRKFLIHKLSEAKK